MRFFLLILVASLLFNASLKSQTFGNSVDMQAQLNVRSDDEQAMWVWHSIDIVYNVGSAQENLFQFCANHPGTDEDGVDGYAQRPINHLFLYAQGFLFGGADEWSALRTFLRESHARGIKVDYLDGDPAWLGKDSMEAKRVMSSLLQFNASGNVTEQFDGVQLDVEPYVLPSWGSEALWNKYVGFLKSVNSTIDTSCSQLTIGCTIPRWYAQTIGTAKIAQIYHEVNYVAILDYVNDVPRLLRDPSEEIAIADSMNIHVYVGVETGSNLLPTLSFCNKGWFELENAIGAINSNYISHKSYAGVSIHNYSAYAELPRSNQPLEDVEQWAETNTNDASAFPASANLVIVRNDLLRKTPNASVIRHALASEQTATKRLVLTNISLSNNYFVYNLISSLDSAHYRNVRNTDRFYGLSAISTIGFLSNLTDIDQSHIILQAQAGYDGFSIDLNEMEPHGQLLGGNVYPGNKIVEQIAQAKELFTENSPTKNSMVVVKVSDGFLQGLDNSHYRKFMSLVNGVIIRSNDRKDSVQFSQSGVKVLNKNNTYPGLAS